MNKFEAVESSPAFREDSLLTRQISGKENRAESAATENTTNARRAKFSPADVFDRGQPATIVIERRALIRDCLVKCLKDGKKHDIVRAFSTTEEWLKERPRNTPTTVVVLCVGEQTDVERDIGALFAADPDLSIVVLSDGEDASSVLSALDKGARGYIPTSMALDVVVGAISLVRAGGTFVPAGTLIASRDSIEKLPLAPENTLNSLFTARQGRVVEALRQGKSNKIIAHELNMCESTVKVHVRNIMKKLNAKNRTEVAFLMNGVEAKSPALAPVRCHSGNGWNLKVA